MDRQVYFKKETMKEKIIGIIKSHCRENNINCEHRLIIAEKDFENLASDLFNLYNVVQQSEQLRFLIDKFQTPKGNYIIDLLMEHKESKP